MAITIPFAFIMFNLQIIASMNISSSDITFHSNISYSKTTGVLDTAYMSISDPTGQFEWQAKSQSPNFIEKTSSSNEERNGDESPFISGPLMVTSILILIPLLKKRRK